MPRQIYQLKVTLVGIEPRVWRRLLVPGGFTLDRVSRIIQVAFGWQGHHLHSFEIAGRQYGEPDPLGELDLDDELDWRLDAVADRGDRFTYVYDFGDWWEHQVVVESIGPADPEQRYPACVAGERAGPPEDVGGPEGYGEVLAVLADPARPDPTGVRDWLVGFDPVRCQPELVSTLLRRMT
jgi:Plasmid pRiA4b ORF-3-like protein